MKKVNVDTTKVLNVLGLGLGLVGSLVASIAADRKNKELITKLVDEKLNNK
jgi:hypothetical protein